MERVVLLASPADDCYDPQIRQGVVEPPLGLLYLAAALERAPACEDVRLVDAYRDPSEADHLEETLAQFRATQLWVSLMSVEGPRCLGSRVKQVRQRLPRVKLVGGGKYFENAPAESLEPGWNGFDLIVRGDADLELERILEAQGLYQCSPLPPIELPYPRRELVDLSSYSGSRPPHHCVVGARGCVGGCTFCAIAKRNPYRRDPANIVLEIEQLMAETHVGCYSIIDDLMPFDRGRFERYCAALGRLPSEAQIDVSWRADRFTPEIAEKLAGARVRIVRFGIESIAPEIQKLLGKPCPREQIMVAVRAARAHGLSAVTYFMFGFPTDTRESVEELLDFMFELSAETPVPPYLGILRVLEGTPLHRVYGGQPAPGLPLEEMLELLAAWRARFPDFFGVQA